MTAHDELHPYLLSLISGQPTPESVAGVDWGQILREAVDHGLLWHLSNSEAPSPEIYEELKRKCLLVSARNLALAGELRLCLQALREARVECAPIRGVALMERVYGEIVARPMGDIDMLVRRCELDALREVLSSLGYREMDRRPGFSEAFSYSLKFLVERSFTIVVEPHLSIAYPPALARLDMDAVWARCVPTAVVGEPALSLCLEDTLLHLALHIAHRDHPPLVWLWELDWLVRAEADDADWDLFVSSAREIGVERIVGHVLAELESVLDTPIPAEAAGRLLSEEGQREGALSQVMAELSEVREREGLAQLLAIEGPGRKLRYLLGLLTPTREFMMQEYGLRSKIQLPWAYLRRGSSFAWEGAKGAARLALSGRSH